MKNLLIQVFLDSQPQKEFTLSAKEAKEMFLGRSSACNIVLKKDKALSRRHLRFFLENGSWKVQNLSKIGLIEFNGEQGREFTLTLGSEFIVGKYKFSISEAQTSIQPKNIAQPPTSLESLPAPNSALTESDDNAPSLFAPNANNEFGGNMESTVAGVSTLEIILEAHYPNGEEDVFKLEGELWVAGRDPKCEIFLRDDHVSRQHFEISKNHDGFYITDLGSSNGTVVHGKRLQPNVPERITSGDEIQVKTLFINFKIEDRAFNQNIQKIDENKLSLSIQGPPVAIVTPTVSEPVSNNSLQTQPIEAFNEPVYLSPVLYQGPAVMRIDADSQEFNWKDFKTYDRTHKIRLVSGIIIFFALIFAFMDDGAKNKPTQQAKKSDQSEGGMASLTLAQKELVKHNFNMAHKSYREQNFSLCISKIEELHGVVENYKDSKRLLTRCQSGKKLALKRKNQQRLKELKEKNQAIINDVVKKCEPVFHTFKTEFDMLNCLSTAISLDPENPTILAFKMKFFEQQKQREVASEQARKQQVAVSKGVSLFNKGKVLYDKKEYKKAIKQLNKYLGSSYPDPNGNKSRARRMIASAEKEFQQSLQADLKICEGYSLANADFVKADLHCRKVLEKDPKNSVAHEARSAMKVTLSNRMKVFYENAAVEESFGNIEAAKELWEKIIKEDHPNGSPYYSKALSKLKKYGLK